jgi:hypothetical protein
VLLDRLQGGHSPEARKRVVAQNNVRPQLIQGLLQRPARVHPVSYDLKTAFAHLADEEFRILDRILHQQHLDRLVHVCPFAALKQVPCS